MKRITLLSFAGVAFLSLGQPTWAIPHGGGGGFGGGGHFVGGGRPSGFAGGGTRAAPGFAGGGLRAAPTFQGEIGRASGRERGDDFVSARGRIDDWCAERERRGRGGR